MSGLLGLVIGLVVIVLFVTVVTFFIDGFQKKSGTTPPLVLGKMGNTDASIQSALKFLELKNGIESYKEN